MSDSPTSHYAGVHEQLVDLQDRYDALERELAEARKAALAEGIRSGEAEGEVERLRGQLSAARDTRDVFARDLNRMVENCDKDTAAHDALVASLTDELRRAKAKAEQYQIDWTVAKAEFGDKMAALRQRHAEAVKKTWDEAFSEGWDALDGTPMTYTAMRDAAWLASSAKKGLES